jgi:hypothetical protein
MGVSDGRYNFPDFTGGLTASFAGASSDAWVIRVVDKPVVSNMPSKMSLKFLEIFIDTIP